MTVSSQVNSVSYLGDGVTTLLPVPYYFLEQDHLTVTRVNLDTTTQTLVLGSDYSVAVAGNQAGGSVTMFAAPASGVQIIIDRTVPATQETDYVANDPFPAESHERALDKLTMLVQQNIAGLGRALLRPVGKNYYAAEGRQIKNLADPTDDQDAATKLWTDQFVANFISQITGPINNSANVFYQYPDGTSHVVQDLATPAGSSGIGFIQSGLGTVARNIQDRMRERVSVKDFAGVIGDGVHDDTVGIQAAINDGRPLDFGGTENVYRITADLIPKNGGRYYGYGATIFQESIGEEAFACTALTDAKFHGLTLIGASPDPLITDGTNRAFELFAPKDVVIELCTMKNWGSAGVFLTGGGGAAYGPINCKVINNLIENCNDGIFTYVGGVGNIISGNTIRRSGRTGIFIDDVSFSAGGTPGIATMLTVTGNIIENYGGFAEAAGITSGAMRRVAILGNIIGPGNGAGISLFAGGAEADAPTPTNGVIVALNEIYRSSKQGVVLVGVQYSQVAHNLIWEPNYGATGNNSGIELQSITRAAVTVGSDRNIIESNTIVRGAADVDNGIRIQASCSNNHVRFNVIEGATSTGVLDQGSGNKVYRNDGYVTENSGTAQITSGNTFIDVTHGLSYTPAAQDISVTPNSSLGAATYWLVSGNPTATTFRIALNANPGATVTLAWSVRKN